MDREDAQGRLRGRSAPIEVLMSTESMFFVGGWKAMGDETRTPRLESRIPSDHPLKTAVEAAVTAALAADDDWSARILASNAVTCWIVEFVRQSDGQREDVVVQPSRFDQDRFRTLVATALRR
jgi:hypothetical protein